jgi:hypothetical protein
MNSATKLAIASAAIVTMSASLASAQVGPELLLKPFSKDAKVDGFAAATYFFDSNTDFDLGNADDVEAQLSRYALGGRIRVMPDHRADPRFGFVVNYFSVDVPDDLLPETFTDAQIGIGTGIAEFDGWVAGLTLGFGFAGDNEFGTSDGYYGAATLLFGRQLDENTSLGIALDYNGNRTFMPDVPLPGFVWTRRIPENDLEVSLGFPFAYGRWRPIEPLLLEINFTIPDFVGARVSYDLAPGIGLFASLASRTDAWNTDRAENDIDRIFFEQRVAEFGARFSVHDNFVLLLAGGYAFGQEFSVGYDSRNTDKITDIDDGPFVRIEGQISF